MARRSSQIPVDDEPVDIDLGDLPTDEELEAAAQTELGPDETGQVVGGAEPAEMGPLELFQLWVVLVGVLYVLIGFGVGLTLAFRGAAQLGLAAMASPQFYLVVLFWPIALWQLFWQQL